MPKFYSDIGVPEGSKVDIASSDWVKDENDLASDSDTHLATQQSIKAYVDDRGFAMHNFVHLISSVSGSLSASNGYITTNTALWSTVSEIQIFKTDYLGVDGTEFYQHMDNYANNPSTLRILNYNGGDVTCTISSVSDIGAYYKFYVSCVTTGGNAVTVNTGSGGLFTSAFAIGMVGLPNRFSIPSGSSAGDIGNGAEITYDIGGSASTVIGKVYVLKSGGWTQVKADVAANCTGLLAVALGGNSTDGMLLRGPVRVESITGLEAVGDILYVNQASGGNPTIVAPSSQNEIVRVLGYAIAGSGGSYRKIFFNPDNTWVEIA